MDRLTIEGDDCLTLPALLRREYRLDALVLLHGDATLVNLIFAAHLLRAGGTVEFERPYRTFLNPQSELARLFKKAGRKRLIRLSE